MYVSCNRHEVRERRLKLGHTVCWTQLSPSLGGVWGHSTGPPPCFSVAEVDATSLLCMALPLFSGKWRPLWWLPQGLSRASCHPPPFLLTLLWLPSAHWGISVHSLFLGVFFFLKIGIGICIWPSLHLLPGTHKGCVPLFHIPLCKVHRGP